MASRRRLAWRVALLTSFGVERLRHRVERGDALPPFVYQGCEAGTHLDLACARRDWYRTDTQHPAALEVDRWARRDDRLAAAIRALDGGQASGDSDSASSWAFVSLGRREAVADVTFASDRFRQQLIAAGCEAQLAAGIAAVLLEMAGNSIEHSGDSEQRPAAGAFGYEVAGGAVAFAVADLGRGVLASLRTNPDWTGLATSADALKAAVTRGASRRVAQGPGCGFSDLHRNLADLSGALRFATGDASLTLEGGSHPRRESPESRATLPGLQLSVAVRFKKDR